MQLQLDDYLIKSGISDIRRIENDIVIRAKLNNKVTRFAVSTKEGQTQQETANLLEIELDKPLGRYLCQYIIQFICKPENWVIVGTSESKSKSKGNSKAEEEKIKKIPIRKYSGNGRLTLHESIVLGLTPKFVGLDKGKPVFEDSIEITPKEVFVPADTINSHNPLPYIFDSEQEFNEYLELANTESFDSIFSKVELVFRRYVDVEDYYYPILVGDIIWSYFQDKFGYTHYNIFVGDNGSGKNSALLTFKYLGYRVFYVVSASAANYYTELGDKEEGQVTIAEDEADDIPLDKDKKNVVNTGYCSGGSVPKVELEGGRRTDSWLTYCHKWFAMEELPDEKKMKATLDRSFVYHFISGDVAYNIKDVIRGLGDPKFGPLLEELMFIRKLLFCYRLVHYNDTILDVELNIKNRSQEVTKSLIRLFANSPRALRRIIDSLSKFMIERNEIKSDSFESKLYGAVAELRDEYVTKTNIKINNEHQIDLSNQEIRDRLIKIVEAEEILDDPGKYYSPIVGTFTQTRITRAAKSRFKAKSIKMEIDRKTARGLRFGQKNLDRIKSNYQIPEKIELKPAAVAGPDFLTLLTLSTFSRRLSTPTVKENEGHSITQNDLKSQQNVESIPSQKVSEVSKVSTIDKDQNQDEKDVI